MHEEQKEGRETEGGRDWVVRTSRRRRRECGRERGGGN